MKKHILFLLLTVCCLTHVSAQEPIIKYQLKTPADKTTAAMEKVKELNLRTDDYEKTNKVIAEFYKDQQKMLDGAIKNGVGDVEAYKLKKQKLAGDRDEKLKKIFSKEQYDTWITVIEPSLQPKRPGPTKPGK